MKHLTNTLVSPFSTLRNIFVSYNFIIFILFRKGIILENDILCFFI